MPLKSTPAVVAPTPEPTPPAPLPPAPVADIAQAALDGAKTAADVKAGQFGALFTDGIADVSDSEALMSDLTAFELYLKSSGHSILELLEYVARSATGTSILPQMHTDVTTINKAEAAAKKA